MSEISITKDQHEIAPTCDKDSARLSMLVDELIIEQESQLNPAYRTLLAFLITCQIDLIVHRQGFKDRRAAVDNLMKDDKRLGLVLSIASK